MGSYLFLFLLIAAAWLEPGSCVSLPHHSYLNRSLRETSGPSTRNYTLRFSLTTNSTPECVKLLGSNLTVELSYRTPGGKWTSLRSFTGVRDPSEVVPLPQDCANQDGVQFRWRQLEQAWGVCNCWQISDAIFSDSLSNSTDLVDNDICTYPEAQFSSLIFPNNNGVILCEGSASVPRGVVTPVYSLFAENIVDPLCMASDLFDPIGDIQLCTRDEIQGTFGTFVKVSFQLAINGEFCNGINTFQEGVELAARWSENEQWVPVKFYTLSELNMNRNEIAIGSYDQDNSVLSLRGYNVSVMLYNTSVMNVTEYICDERFFRDGVQFRWLQTTRRSDSPAPRDTWYIDDVKIAVHRNQGSSRLEFFDDFSDSISINNTLWPQVRGGRLRGTETGDGIDCIPEDVFLFGANDTEFNTTVVRMAMTKPLNLEPDIDAVQMIIDLLSDIEGVPPSEILLTLRSLLGNLPAGVTFPRNVSELLFDSMSDLIDIVQQSDNDEDDVDPAAIGSTLLDVMDRFALGPYDPEQGELEDNDNIALVHMILTTTPDDDPVEGITRDGNTILLPREVFLSFNTTNLTVASYYYRNMSRLLPDSLPHDPQSSNTTMTLASGVLSSALQCGSTQCNTRDLNLEYPVVLTFNHPQETVDELQRQDESNRSVMVVCVFWDFDDSSTNELSNGQWATEGCNMTASNESHTVCECNHLTHFALLLSTTEVQLTSAEALSLRIIGIICVTISLVSLTVTILTFLFLKSLWSMRNYIHINLCASLFVAQLTFIVAVEPHGSVVGCQAVAVLLHYFFLVTFMWMLMEGVVLYVALVRVFIKYQNRYLIAFTLASYGIPLLYLGITVPLGFALQDANGPHYAGDDPQSCWLRYDSHFIWAFITPVIVIILTNIGFFIMAITIMYHHQQRETHKTKLTTIKHWLKASISLVVVMGITWIIGILVFNRDLLFVAYIYTIFIGLQGLAIFILFVVLSKQVREAYTKWWKIKVASSDFLSRHFGEKSYASQTAMTAMGASTSKNTLPMDNTKSQGMRNSLSPNLTDNGHTGRLHVRKEEKEDHNSISNGNTSFGNTGGGTAVKKEVEEQRRAG